MAAVGIELSEAALVELQETIDFLWDQSPDGAREFAESYRAAILQIREYPLSGQILASGERRLRVGSTPYQLIYQLSSNIAVVIALAHSARRPGYWRDRL